MTVLYAAASSIFSINIPQPVVGSLTRTCVTAPTSFPSCIIGEPDTLMSSVGQKKFVFFCGFYSFLRVKGRFWHTSTAVLNLTQMKCRKYRILRLPTFSTNSDICRTVGIYSQNIYVLRFSGGHRWSEEGYCNKRTDGQLGQPTNSLHSVE